MKTLKEGAVQPIVRWWVGRRLDCPSCRGIFELEASDNVLLKVLTTDKDINGFQSIEVNCPTDRCYAKFRVHPHPLVTKVEKLVGATS